MTLKSLIIIKLVLEHELEVFKESECPYKRGLQSAWFEVTHDIEERKKQNGVVRKRKHKTVLKEGERCWCSKCSYKFYKERRVQKYL